MHYIDCVMEVVRENEIFAQDYCFRKNVAAIRNKTKTRKNK